MCAPDDRIREAIQYRAARVDCFVAEFIIGTAEGRTRWLLAMTVRARRESWIASRSLSAGAHSRDPLARNDGERPAPSSRHHHLIADDDEFRQIHPPKTRGERDVGGVAAGAHQDAADPGVIVAGGEERTATRRQTNATTLKR